MFTNFFRVFKFGWHEFSRNIGISLGTIFVIFIALSLGGGTLLLRGMSEKLIMTLQEKVDVSVYFKEETKEKNVLLIKEKVENIPEVKSVEYISKEKALETFKETHKDSPLLIESLAEIGSNPLPASLNIKAAQASSYEKLANFLEEGEYKGLIEKVNYRQNQAIIERLFSISGSIKQGGVVVSIILIFIAVIVTFNTIKLAIYSKREEIENMKLIGATSWFARGPFLVQGIIIGFLAGIFAFLFFYGVEAGVSPSSLGVFGELGFLNFFEENILIFLLVQIGGGILISIFSSFLAVQKYLNV